VSLPGFSVAPFVTGMEGARVIRVAPNGDIFLARSRPDGKVMVIRAKPGADKPDRVETFAADLKDPYGIAFYPPGPDPKWVYIAGNRGIAHRAKGNLDAALQDFNEAIRLKPDHAPAFNNRGDGRRDKGDLDGALQDFNEAIRLKPDYALAFENRGNARRAKGDLNGALQDFNEASRLKK
jgi:tetratricopeptide (TPR) repeat protein